MKHKIISYLKKFSQFEKINLKNLLKIPKFESQGDFTIPIFFIKKNQEILLKELQNKKPKFLKKITIENNYINFFLEENIFCKKIIGEILNGDFFKIKIKNPQKILIEYPSPNTNKALHIGHMRNIFLGNSLSNILEFVGHKIILTNLYNDRGIAICKTMLMYEKYGKNKNPDCKSDLFIQKFYEMFEKKKTEKLENEALKYLEMWEAGELRDLWKKILDWVYSGYSETYKLLYMKKFDKIYYESEIYDKGKKIILECLEKKILGFSEDEKGIFCEFDDESIGKKYLLRKNLTTLYMTQDIYLAELKKKQFDCDKNIFIVGSEQQYHFKILFEILNRIDKKNEGKNFHFSYGIIYDKNGKKFSSRLGNVITIDEIFEMVGKISKKKLIEKKFTKKDLDEKAKIISYSTLLFSILKYSPKDKINLDIEKSLSQIGNTASYILYTYARINSILKKYNGKKDNGKFIFSKKEFSILKKINEFENIVMKSSILYSPNLLCNFLIEICREFNNYYNDERILDCDDTEKKILILKSVKKNIEKISKLINLKLLDSM